MYAFRHYIFVIYFYSFTHLTFRGTGPFKTMKDIVRAAEVFILVFLFCFIAIFNPENLFYSLIISANCLLWISNK